MANILQFGNYKEQVTRMLKHEQEIDREEVKRIRGKHVVEIRKSKRESLFSDNRNKHHLAQHLPTYNQNKQPATLFFSQTQQQTFSKPTHFRDVSQKTEQRSQGCQECQSQRKDVQDSRNHQRINNISQNQQKQNINLYQDEGNCEDAKTQVQSVQVITQKIPEFNIKQFYQKQKDKSAEHHNRLILDEGLKDEIQRIFDIDQSALDAEELLRKVTQQHDTVLIHEGIIGLRRLVSVQFNGELRQRLSMQECWLQRLIWWLKCQQYIHLKWQCIWIVINLSTQGEECCKEMVNLGIISILHELLSNTCTHIVWQTIIAIQNISATALSYRMQFVSLKTISKLIAIARQTTESVILEECLHPINSLCIYEPYAYIVQIQRAFDFMAELIESQRISQKMMVICINTWVYCLRHKINNVSIVSQRILKVLMDKCEQLNKEGKWDCSMFKKIMSMMEIISEGTELQTQILIDSHILNLCLSNLKTHDKSVMADTIFILSNLSASTRLQISTILQQPQILSICASQYKQPLNHELKTQVSHFLYNVMIIGERQRVLRLIEEYNIFELMREALLQLLEQDGDGGRELLRVMVQLLICVSVQFGAENLETILCGQIVNRFQTLLYQGGDGQVQLSMAVLVDRWRQKKEQDSHL